MLISHLVFPCMPSWLGMGQSYLSSGIFFAPGCVGTDSHWTSTVILGPLKMGTYFITLLLLSSSSSNFSLLSFGWENIHLFWDAAINRIRLGGLICSLKSFLQLNMCQELQIFAVVCIVFGCKLSLVRLWGSDFVITFVDDITVGIICAAFCFQITHIVFASSWYNFLFVGYCFGEIMCIWESYVYQ